ncbi:bacteriorhodopsin [Micromonospora olivasterospora]|uniref:Bacteriorhodopsin n=1 Tax=Micromonospora olivasterospora TaxID=1880 RepID=A0A562IFJ8_MICOL|nr:bacteriorhodopsin [Micromonospora olivasterospora]TWH69777.1 bacteriorhodopsin [Micromonospora olivasterospora]
MAEWWLWSYVILCAAALLLFVRWSRNPKGIPQSEYLVVFVVLGWSAIWHVVAALDAGRTRAADPIMEWAHYADWIVTAPLLAFSLVLTATHAIAEKRIGLVTALIVPTIPMILAGPVAEAMRSPTARFASYGIGMVALGLVLGLIWGPLRADAERQPAPMAAHFIVVALLLSLLWLAFPLVWILGPPGVEILDEDTSAILFVVLSALMKVGWSIVDVGRLRAMSDRGQLAVA